ncbi:MAG: hypothetical protein AAGH15_19440 [Myxococcota bacterium]
MILLKRAIPRLPVAALVLGGCGDSGEFVPTTELCELEQRCFPENFATFATFADCEGVYETYLETVRSRFGQECYDLYLAALECTLPFYQATCNPYDPEGLAACAAELDAYDEACRLYD